MGKMVAWQAPGKILALESEAHAVKWLVRIVGVLLLFVAVAMVVLLVFMGIELESGLTELIGQGWLLIIMCAISVGLGIYMLRLSGRFQLPTGKEE